MIPTPIRGTLLEKAATDNGFDRGFMTIDDSGRVIVSDLLDPAPRQVPGLEKPLSVHRLDDKASGLSGVAPGARLSEDNGAFAFTCRRQTWVSERLNRVCRASQRLSREGAIPRSAQIAVQKQIVHMSCQRRVTLR